MEVPHDERIEKYNLGHLSGTELEQFEADMRADPGLAQAVREHRTAWEVGELLAEERLREQIRARLPTAPSPPEEPTRLKSRKYALPALLLCLLGAAVFFMLKNKQDTAPHEPAQNLPAPQNSPEKTPSEAQPPSPETQQPETAPKPSAPIAQAPKQPVLRTLALANYRVPDGLSGIRGTDDGDLLSRAAQAFFEKKYTRTLDLLKNLPENDRQEALSLRAHAHFGAAHFAAAAHDFSDLEKGGVYRREAQWFGVLARLAANPTDGAAALRDLEAIVRDSTHPYQRPAEALKRAVSSGTGQR